jgi:hypothetical protein
MEEKVMACPYCSDEERRWAAAAALRGLVDLADDIREDIPAVYTVTRLALLDIEPLLGEEGRRLRVSEDMSAESIARSLVNLGIYALAGIEPIHPETWREADRLLYRYLEQKDAADHSIE